MVSAAFPLRQHPQWARGPAHIDGDEIVLDETAAETFFLSESDHRQRLLSDLIALRECKPDEVVNFVARHGLLWHGPEDLGNRTCREPLADWRAEITHLWVTAGLYWEIKVAEEIGTAKPVHSYLRNLRALNIFSAVIPERDGERLEMASVLLAERITRGMGGCSWTLVAACTLSREGVKEGGPTDFLFGEDPPNLLAAAYAQFASLIVNRAPFMECEGCGILFTPEHGSQRYCTPHCNGRVRQARRKAKEG